MFKDQNLVGIVSKHIPPNLVNTVACTWLGHPKIQDFIAQILERESEILRDLGYITSARKKARTI